MKSPEDAMRELGIDRAALAEAMATMWRFRSDLQTLIMRHLNVRQVQHLQLDASTIAIFLKIQCEEAAETLEDIADRLETKEHQIDA